MTESQTVDLSGEQIDMLLRGLRFIRSSILLDPHIPSDEDDARREAELDTIEELKAKLTGEPTRSDRMSLT